MKQKKMKTSYAKFVQVGHFDKGKYIEGKLKVLSDMCITLTEGKCKPLTPWTHQGKLKTTSVPSSRAVGINNGK